MDSLPNRQELMAPTVQALKELGGSGSIDEITTQVIVLLDIPDDLASQPYITKRGLVDSRTRLEYELAWARTYLKQLGVVENSSRGVWILTGKVLRNEPVPDPNPPYATPDNNWSELVLNYLIETLTPSAFERLIQRILRESGFSQVEVTGKSGDGGIDGRGLAKINGILSFQIVFQCKRYRGSVGSSEIRNFRGAMQGRADKGLFITTGYFTRDAIKEASRDGAINIDLIDGEKLAEKLKELHLGVTIERFERITVDEEWFKSI